MPERSEQIPSRNRQWQAGAFLLQIGTHILNDKTKFATPVAVTVASEQFFRDVSPRSGGRGFNPYLAVVGGSILFQGRNLVFFDLLNIPPAVAPTSSSELFFAKRQVPEREADVVSFNCQWWLEDFSSRSKPACSALYIPSRRHYRFRMRENNFCGNVRFPNGRYRLQAVDVTLREEASSSRSQLPCSAEQQIYRRQW